MGVQSLIYLFSSRFPPKMNSITPAPETPPKIMNGGDNGTPVPALELSRILQRLNSSTSSPNLPRFRQENITPVTSPKLGRFQQNFPQNSNTTTSISKLARLHNETHSTITSANNDTISSVSSSKLERFNQDSTSPLSSPKLGRSKPEHHRSVQQLAEKLSELKPLQIFPATWEKLST